MMACTSPAFTVRSTPRRISRPSAEAWRLSISSIGGIRMSEERLSVVSRPSADGALKTDAQQVLRFHRELHGKLPEHFLAEAVHDHGNGVFRLEAALPEIKDLILADLGGRGFVLHDGGAVAHVDVRERMRP